MEISVNVGYFGPHISNEKNLITELDELGISCIWTAEAYGYDAVTPLAYFAALTKNVKLGSGIMQIPGRTPAMTAMTAATIDKLSQGRFRLGVGVSGPQVVEGWHGVAYGKPLKKN
jgi:alkanesulfonate monooxygenase SsuD/methylene tetrahydromethanopterin reductase-like flavin-dependent oxidoreductase (luciferase family)